MPKSSLANRALRAAISRQLPVGVQAAIAAGADVNFCDGFGLSPLHFAASQGDVAMLRHLVHAGADLRQLSPDNLFPMAQSAANGKLAALRELSALCADFESPLPFGKGALEVALESGHMDVVTYLIEHGADVEAPSSDGETLLHRFCSAQNLPAVKCLVLAGANVHAVLRESDGRNLSVLDVALSGESTQIFREIAKPEYLNVLAIAIGKRLHSHVRSETHDYDVMSHPQTKLDGLFFYALAWCGWSAVTRMIHSAYDKLYRLRPLIGIDNNGGEVLIDALLHGDLKKASHALMCGANPNTRTRSGTPAIIVAVRAYQVMKNRRLADASSAYSSSSSSEQIDIEDAILKNQHVIFMLTMISAGADVQARDTVSGRNMMHESCIANHDKLIRALLDENIGMELINRSDVDLNRPLHLAVEAQCYASVEFLSAAGADINPVNKKGLTPLHLAIMKMDVHSVARLNGLAANVNLGTRAGISVLSLVLPGQKNTAAINALLRSNKTDFNALTIFSANNPVSAIAKEFGSRVSKR